MAKSLVIGYGNSLRSDDSIGVRIAEIVASWHLPEVRSLSRPQLTPELAADLAQVDLVIFVDACQILDLDTVKLHSLKPLDSNELRSHFSNPRAILSLTQAVYGKCPQAWWVIVPGVNFQFGDRLSSVGEKGVSQAAIQIRNLLVDRDICTK
ncbi:MAG TPA: hydrogenase maturation protease [Xenococcaceae cyanobacterium]